jgi:hypothetical protein
MNGNNFLIECSNADFARVQERVRRLLFCGLDVRVSPVSRNRGLLPRHVLTAIERQYGVDPWRCLAEKGVKIDNAYPISDDAALALVSHRAISELDPQPNLTPAPINGNEWHLENVRAPQAWAMLGGVENIKWQCTVGQIDTGYTRHPALGFVDGKTSWLDVARSRNFYTGIDADGTNPPDLSGLDPLTGFSGGHGTRIGSTISGYHILGDTGKTFYGCAPKVPHIVTRISNSIALNGKTEIFADALNYLVNSCRVDVVNLSMGEFPSGMCPEAIDAINNAYERGVILICAAGQYVGSVVSPACLNRTIAIAGTTSEDLLWALSSRGKEVDWSASSADIRRAITPSENQYSYKNNGDGTSYGTALTSGAAALWLTYHAASLRNQYSHPWQRIEAFRAAAINTARQPRIWGAGVAGAGILNIERLLLEPLPSSETLTEQIEAS